MKEILAYARQVHQNVQQINLKYDKKKYLPDFRVIPILENYTCFLKALTYCKTVAQKEYEYVIDEVQKLSNLTNDVQVLQTELNAIVPNNKILLEEDQPTQEQTAKMLKDTIASFSNGLQDSIKEIKKNTEEYRDKLSTFQLVLFGKTKVGKSTVREALTKGDGESIGKGGQSTTLENHQYNWYNLRVWDTPGTLSVRDTNQDQAGKGQEEQTALKILEDSDIAVFMFTSDNIEEAELNYLRDNVCNKNKEILILLNVKADISDYRRFMLRKKDREISVEAQKGNIKRIMSSIPQADVKLLPVHAQAAFFSRGYNAELVKFYNDNKVSRTELYNLSHFGEIRNYIVENILNRGAAMRTTTIRTKFIDQVLKYAKSNETPINNCLKRTQKVLDLIKKTEKQVNQKVDYFLKNLHSNIQSQVRAEIDTYDIASECINNRYGKDTIKSVWESKLENSNLSKIPKAVLEDFQNELRNVLDEMAKEMKFIQETNETFDGLGAYSAPWSDAMKFGGLAAGLCSAAAMVGWIPGGGWVVAGLAAVSVIFSILGGFFKSKETKIRELREKFDSCLNQIIDSLTNQVAKVCNEKISPKISSNFKNAIETQEKLLHICNKYQEKNNILFQTAEDNKKNLADKLNAYNGNKINFKSKQKFEFY